MPSDTVLRAVLGRRNAVPEIIDPARGRKNAELGQAQAREEQYNARQIARRRSQARPSRKCPFLVKPDD